VAPPERDTSLSQPTSSPTHHFKARAPSWNDEDEDEAFSDLNTHGSFFDRGVMNPSLSERLRTVQLEVDPSRAHLPSHSTEELLKKWEQSRMLALQVALKRKLFFFSLFLLFVTCVYFF
jgi:hypothetical protein